MKQQVLNVPVEIFNRGVLVFLGSQEQLKNYVRQKYPEYEDDVEEELSGGSAYTIKLKDDAIIFAESIIPESEMVHEIVHAAIHLLSLVEVQDKEGNINEEALCYLVEYLARKILPWLTSISCESR